MVTIRDRLRIFWYNLPINLLLSMLIFIVLYIIVGVTI